MPSLSSISNILGSSKLVQNPLGQNQSTTLKAETDLEAASFSESMQQLEIQGGGQELEGQGGLESSILDENLLGLEQASVDPALLTTDTQLNPSETLTGLTQTNIALSESSIVYEAGEGLRLEEKSLVGIEESRYFTPPKVDGEIENSSEMTTEGKTDDLFHALVEGAVEEAPIPAYFTNVSNTNVSRTVLSETTASVSKGAKVVIEGLVSQSLSDDLGDSESDGRVLTLRPGFLESKGGSGEPDMKLSHNGTQVKQGSFPDLLQPFNGLKEVASVLSGSSVDSLNAAVYTQSNSSSALVTQPSASVLPGAQAWVSESGRVNIPVNITFGQPQWSAAMAEKTAWAVSQNIQSADIQLDPPELGPIQVKIHVHQDQASVSFVSANQGVREALDQSMSRLKELLGEQGMDLVDSGVSDHENKQSKDSSSETLSEVSESDASDESLSSVQVDIPQGIDYFA